MNNRGKRVNIKAIVILIIFEIAVIWLVDIAIKIGYLSIGKYDLHTWTLLTLAISLSFNYHMIRKRRLQPLADRVKVNAGSPPRSSEGDPKYHRMGGWLSFFVFSQLGIVPLYTMGILLFFFAVPAARRTDGQIASLIAYLVLVVFGIIVAAMLLKRKPMAASFAKLFFVGVIGLNAANIIIGSSGFLVG